MREVHLNNARDIRRALRQLQWHLRRVERRQTEQEMQECFETYITLRRGQTRDMATQTEATKYNSPEIKSAQEAMPLNVAVASLATIELAVIEAIRTNDLPENAKEHQWEHGSNLEAEEEVESPILSIIIESDDSEYNPERPDM